MAKYIVKIARIEHHVYTLEIDADNEENASEAAWSIYEGGDFTSDEYEVVNAEEFISDIEED